MRGSIGGSTTRTGLVLGRVWGHGLGGPSPTPLIAFCPYFWRVEAEVSQLHAICEKVL